MNEPWYTIAVIVATWLTLGYLFGLVYLIDGPHSPLRVRVWTFVLMPVGMLFAAYFAYRQRQQERETARWIDEHLKADTQAEDDRKDKTN